jgi:acyl-CoA thioesterase-1
MIRFMLCLILAGAVGCKAGHTSSASSHVDELTAPVQSSAIEPAPAVPVQPISSKADRAGEPLIVCFGDSLTAGYGADEGESYPDFLQKDLDRAGYRYRVVNEGISGNTSKDGVDRLTTITDLRPVIVLLEFGGNDGLRGIQTSTTRANLAQMIDTLKASGAKVVLLGITLPPDYGPDYIKSFTGNYTSLAHQNNLPLLPFLLQNVYGVSGMMQADGIHATDKGNEIVARNVLPYVEKVLKK